MNWQLSGLWVVQVVDVPDKLPDNNGPAPGGLTQALGASAGGPAGPQQRAPTRKRRVSGYSIPPGPRGRRTVAAWVHCDLPAAGVTLGPAPPSESGL